MGERRRAIVAVVAAGVVIVAAVAVILAFGLIPVPEYPSLAEHPDPSIPGTVAFIQYPDRPDVSGPCLYLVPASGGTPRQVLCEAFGEGGPMWTKDGKVVLWKYPSSYLIVDPTSEPTSVERVPGDPEGFKEAPMFMMDRAQVRDDGATVLTDRSWETAGAASVVVQSPDGTTRTLLRPERAPADYRFDWAMWSPDGNWVLVTDSDGRLIVADARGGDPNPRILVDGLRVYGGNVSWYIPGYDRYTIDLDE